jgi:thioesterase domain-containing protein/acyl carrier protein
MTHEPKTLPGDTQDARGHESSYSASLHSVETTTRSKPVTQQFVGAVSPTRDIEAVLVGWWKKLLSLETVNLDDDFFELGGQSLTGVELFSKIEKTYGIELRLSTLLVARTVQQLAQLISQASDPSHVKLAPDLSVVAIQPHGSRPPLYVIPGGYGTTVLPYREVSLLLGLDQPVYGFESKVPAPDQELERIPERAARFTEELRSVQPEGPYCLFGWCSGGYIAFEMAQQLHREGQEVAVLAIAQCAVPGYPESWAGKLRFFAERGVWRIQNFLKRGPRGMARRAGERTIALAKAMHLPVGKVDRQLPENRIPPAPPPMDEMDEMVWRNVYRYRPTVYPGKSFVIIGRDYWNYGGLSPSVDPRVAWCKLSQGGSEFRIVPGAHMDILKAPNSQRFAQELKDCLERYTSRS